MNKITTADCKDFILASFNLSSTSSIKRIRKYKNSDGLVVRDFLINEKTPCSLVEDARGSLSLVPTDTSRSTTSFDPKKFIKTYQKSYENSDDTDKVLETYTKKIKALSPEDKARFTSLFTFCFPDGIYNNIVDSITEGLNTPMINQDDSSSYCFVIYYDPELEQMGISDLIRPLLPFYYTAVDEDHFEMFFSDFLDDDSDELKEIFQQYNLDDFTHSLSSDEKKRIKHFTLADVYNHLVSIGFKHQSADDGYYDTCMLRVAGLLK